MPLLLDITWPYQQPAQIINWQETSEDMCMSNLVCDLMIQVISIHPLGDEPLKRLIT